MHLQQPRQLLLPQFLLQTVLCWLHRQLLPGYRQLVPQPVQQPTLLLLQLPAPQQLTAAAGPPAAAAALAVLMI